jgi:anti-sigma regulatory factor (Ser/Thr protein kinase)
MPNGERSNAARVQSRMRRPNGAPQAAARRPARRSAGSPQPVGALTQNKTPMRNAPPVLDQAFDPRGLPALRSAVAAYAARLGAGERLDDVVLIAHELSTNVVRHGGGTGRLRLWREDGSLLCRVSDTGPGLADVAHAGTRLPAPQKGGGRGLWIARTLSDVRIDTGPHGTTVTAAVAVP